MDKRPATPGFWIEVFGPVAARHRPEPSQQGRKRPVRVSKVRRVAAELRDLLDPALADVSVNFLEGLVAPWVRAHWSTRSILRRIHGNGVPALIRTAHGYLKSRLLQVPTGFSPDQRTEVHERLAEIEQENAAASQHRVDTLARTKRARIADCPLCDIVGWVEIDPGVVVRCSHDPATGGW